jgi:hypothetical protein
MKQLIPILKTIGVLTAFAAGVWGAFEAVDAIRDAQREQQIEQQLNHQQVMTAVCNVSRKVDSLAEITSVMVNKQDNLEKSFMFYRHNVDKITDAQMEEIILNAYGMGYETAKKKDLTSLLIEEGYTK